MNTRTTRTIALLMLVLAVLFSMPAAGASAARGAKTAPATHRPSAPQAYFPSEQADALDYCEFGDFECYFNRRFAPVAPPQPWEPPEGCSTFIDPCWREHPPAPVVKPTPKP